MAQPNNLSKAGSLPPVFSQMQDLLAEDLRHACSLGDKGVASKTEKVHNCGAQLHRDASPQASMCHCVLQ